MSTDWDKISSDLKINDKQSHLARYLIDRGKDRCLELWSSRTSDQLLPPIQYAVWLEKRTPALSQSEKSAALINYLSSKRKQGVEESYLRVQYGYEESIKRAFEELFDDEQFRTFGNMEVGSLLLDIDTGYAPLDDYIEQLGQPQDRRHERKRIDTRSGDHSELKWTLLADDLHFSITSFTEPGLELRAFCNELSLDSDSEFLLKFIFDELQDECALLYSTMAAEYALSPMEYAVEQRLNGSGPRDISRSLAEYLGRTRTFEGSNTYLMIQSKLESHVYREVLNLLDDPFERLEAAQIRSFLNVDTGHRKIASMYQAILEETKLKRRTNIFCEIPFEYAHIEDTGTVFPCCPSKFRLSIGNLKQNTMREVWDSDAARAVRESMHDKTYRFCDYSACEYLKQARERCVATEVSTSADKEVVQECSRVADQLPKVVNLAYDRACNLACSYCRTELYDPRNEDHDFGPIHRNLISGGLQGVQRLVISGNGDAFASRSYMNFLQNFDVGSNRDLRIKIQTNGLLLTSETWKRIEKSHSAIDWISVSVDAATRATYALNRGGDFDRLLACLELVGELRRKDEIDLFYINFVVQANNFREMKQFVALGETYGCDLIEFQSIEDWGTLSNAAFKRVAIQDPSHPNHVEFLKFLDDPIFARPKVYLQKLLEFAPDHVRQKHRDEEAVSYQIATAKRRYPQESQG